MLETLIKLFLRFVQMGLFSIGGGYAIIPIIQEQVVESSHWISLREFTDIITISQMTPGPLVVNTASFVGIRIAGVPGAVLATVGSIIGGFVISIGLYHFFQKHRGLGRVANVLRGLRATSLGLIASAASTILLLALFGAPRFHLSSLNLPALIVFMIALVLLRKYKPSPILVIILTGLSGLLLYA